MTKLQPAVRLALSALAAGLAVVVAQIDDETIRVIAMGTLTALAAIGITPPQIPVRTVVAPGNEPANVIHEERGHADPLYLLAVVVLAVILLWLVVTLF